jgi:hypothetical protein
MPKDGALMTAPTEGERLAAPGRAPAGPTRRGRPKLLVTGLLALSAIPVIAGMFRMGQLAGGAETADNARFLADPVPIATHIIGVTTFAALGAFQFVPRLRRRRPGRLGWHRAAGWLLVACGFAGPLAGIWMILFYPGHDASTALPDGVQIAFGSAWTVCVALGFAAIRRRDIARHRTWMTRGYALALGGGTQALLFLAFAPIVGTPEGVVEALLLGGAWVINLAVAEWGLRRRRYAKAPASTRPFPNRQADHARAGTP